MADLYRVKKVINWLIFNETITNISDLAGKMGYNKSSFSQILNAKVPLSDKFLEKLLIIAECINKDWLFRGHGTMFKNVESMPAFRHNSAIIAPLISRFAFSRFVNNYDEPEFLDSQPKYVAAREYSPGNYVAFEISSNNMDDNSKRSICEGDIVLGRELENIYWKQKFYLPKVCVIVHKTKGILVKEVISHDLSSGIITCHRWNPDVEYEDFDLNLSEILQLFTVKEISRQKKGESV
jgi:transcriptional regulator with XRE-family HTH domain